MFHVCIISESNHSRMWSKIISSTSPWWVDDAKDIQVPNFKKNALYKYRVIARFLKVRDRGEAEVECHLHQKNEFLKATCRITGRMSILLCLHTPVLLTMLSLSLHIRWMARLSCTENSGVQSFEECNSNSRLSVTWNEMSMFLTITDIMSVQVRLNLTNH